MLEMSSGMRIPRIAYNRSRLVTFRDVECIPNNLVVLDLNLSLGCFVQGPEVNELIVDLGEQVSLGDDDSVTN